MINDRIVMNNPPSNVTAQSGMLSQNPQLLIAVVTVAGNIVWEEVVSPELVIIVDTTREILNKANIKSNP